jgi:hypothetical protein
MEDVDSEKRRSLAPLLLALGRLPLLPKEGSDLGSAGLSPNEGDDAQKSDEAVERGCDHPIRDFKTGEAKPELDERHGGAYSCH